jgi:predicted  nucleic acid-binding Zn-ribbon protein
MAENIGFNVKVGMDVAEIQSELQKAENQLRQFQAQLKKSTNTIEINMLNTEIKALNTQISAYGQALQKVGKPVGDATQSLINFSRIAQDAPFGMMGIANNLNPMVESFQRLAATEGGTKKALAAMVSGLTGPAGIGVAIGLLSALLSTYSKEIGNFFKGATGELDDFIKKINTLNDELFKIAGKTEAKKLKAEVLIGIIGSKADMQERQTALTELKKLYSESEAINNLTIASDKKAMDAALANASIQYSVIEKEKNNNTKLEEALAEKERLTAKRKAELDKITGPKLASSVMGVTSELSVEQQKSAINFKYTKDFEKVNADITKFKSSVVELNTELSKYEKVDNKQNKVSELDKALQELNKDLLEGENKLKRNKLFEVSGEKSFALNQLNAIEKAINSIAGISGPAADAAIQKLLQQENAIYDKYYSGKPKVAMGDLDASNIPTSTSYRATDKYTGGGIKSLDPVRTAREMQMLDKEANAIFIKGEIDKEKEVSKLLKKQQQAYENFAGTISNSVTNAFMGLFDAMERGANVGEALGEMFKNLLKQIAAAVIQALIFKAIMAAISGGTSEVAGGATGLAGFINLLAPTEFASGGIVSSPTLGLVGEAGTEAIIPLSKLSNFLNTSFNAGAMSSGVTGNGGQFVLRGQDLLLSINRSQKASNLKGQNISLA